MNTKLSYIISNGAKNIVVTLGQKVYPIDSSHPNFGPIVLALKSVAKLGPERVARTLKKLVDVSSAIKYATKGKVEVVHGQVFYGGSPLHNYGVDALLSLLKDGFDIRPLQNFLTRLMRNPNAHSREHLYRFAETNGLPLTDEGKIVAFKIVRSDYMDRHSQKIRNRVGDSPSMDRKLVGDNVLNVCGERGLYVGGFKYCHKFGSGDGSRRIMIIEIDPADFCCIPDGEHGKARVCRYTVVSELDEKETTEFNSGRDILSENKVFNRTQKRDAAGHFVSGWVENSGSVVAQKRDRSGRFV